MPPIPVDPPPPGGGCVGTATAPCWRLNVDGTTVSLPANGLRLLRLVAHGVTSDSATLEFAVVGGQAGTLPDPYLGLSITLEADWGDGWALLFSGRTAAVGHAWTPRGWSRQYRARSLRYLGDRIPVTNPVDGTDVIAFNLAPDDPQYRASRAAKTVGYILRYALDAPDNAVALRGYGIGDYKSAGGWGATAHCTLSGGSVTVVMDTAGSGYSQANPPRAILVGGDGTYTSCTVAVNALGEVTGVTATGATGYTVAPEVWISPLPVTTLNDLAAMALVPPFPVNVEGERLLDAIASVVQSTTRNTYFHVTPAGIMRFIHADDFDGPITLNFDSASDLVDIVGVTLSRSVEDCFPRVKVRGAPNVRAVLLGLAPPEGSAAADGGLAEDFGHSGLTNAQAKSLWNLSHYTQPGQIPGRATASATLLGGAVNALTLTNAGFGYTPNATGISVTITDSKGTGAAYTANASSSGWISSFTKTSGGSSYVNPTISIHPPAGAVFDSGAIVTTEPGASTSVLTLESDDNERTLAANFWDHTAAGRAGVLFAMDSMAAGIDARWSGRIVANEALTIDSKTGQLPYEVTVEGQIPLGDWDYYEIYGLAGGPAEVWRDYVVTIDEYAGKILDRFPYPVPYRSASGLAVSMTSVAVATVLYSNTGNPPFQTAAIGIDVDPDTGHILTHVPTPLMFGTRSSLAKGGSSIDGIPSDFQVLLPVADGTRAAVCPGNAYGYAYGDDEEGYGYNAPEYAGTSYTVEGLEETLTVTIPSWIDPSLQGNMEDYACEIHGAVSDTVVEGTIPLLRFHGPLLATFGQKVRLDASYVLPWDNIDLPVLETTLDFTSSSSGTLYRTTLSVGNRRSFLSAEFFAKPPAPAMQLGLPYGSAPFVAGMPSFGGMLGHDFAGAAAAESAAQFANATGGPYSGAVWQATQAQVGRIGAAADAHAGRIGGATDAHVGRIWGGVNKTIGYAKQLFAKWLQ